MGWNLPSILQKCCSTLLSVNSLIPEHFVHINTQRMKNHTTQTKNNFIKNSEVKGGIGLSRRSLIRTLSSLRNRKCTTSVQTESTSFEKVLECIALSNGLKRFSIQEMIIQDEEENRNMLYEMASHFSFEQKVMFKLSHFRFLPRTHDKILFLRKNGFKHTSKSHKI